MRSPVVSSRPRPRRCDDDHGLVVVIVAACMAALVFVAALVVDLGGARQAKARDQNTADAIALAGAARIDPTGSSNEIACTAAWNYVLTNTGMTSSPAPSCSTFSGTCAADTERTTSVTQGDYTITFINPVVNTNAFFTDQPALPADGIPCERFGVRISHSWHYFLQSGATTLNTSALAHFAHSPGDVNAPLVVMDPHACEALVLNGNSHVTMTSATGTPGYIAIDSDGANCTTGNKVVVDATGTSQITAGGIAMWALAVGNTAKAYDPSDVGPTAAIYPAPVASSAPVGRTGMTYAYDCVPANGCPGSGPSKIATLVAADGGTGVPSGFTRWSSVYPCSFSSDTAIPAGNWYVDCAGGVSTSAKLTFKGGNIVADGPFTLTGSGALRTNCNVGAPADACPSSQSAPTTLYLRHGGFNKSGSASMTLNQTFVYLAEGGIDFSGNGSLTWTAPNDPADTFNNLLVWIANSSPLKFTGNTATTVEGIFYAPDSAATISGSSGAAGIGAQIFVKTATMSGDLTLSPRIDRVLKLGGASSSLLR